MTAGVKKKLKKNPSIKQKLKSWWMKKPKLKTHNKMKKFKDTKLGQFLKEKAPKILDKVADFLPDRGIIGIVKNIIDTDPEAKEAFAKMDPKDQIELQRLYTEYEVEMYKIEQEDRANARNREIEYVKAGRYD